MDKIAHIIYTPVTGVGLHGGFRGDAWFKHRLNIFKNYTLKSLLNQSNRDFIHWFSFRPEEQGHPLVVELDLHLSALDYPHIFTYNGLMYWDDKFTNYSPRVMLRNFLMMLWDSWIYKTLPNPLTLLKYTWENKNRTLLQRVGKSLQVIKDRIGSDYDWVYMTRIDSDDMLHRESIALIQKQEPAVRKALVFDKGYILNVLTGQVAEWNPPTNPPFHTIIFPGKDFFSAAFHVHYYGDFRTHEDIPKVFNAVTLDSQFMVSYHGKHISTAWDSPLPKKAYHKLKYGSTEPFKGYMYTTSGQNISTHWESRTGHVRNFMIGQEFEDKAEILKQFGLN